MLNPINSFVAVGASVLGVGIGLALGTGLAVAAHTALALEPKR
ncbi:hypothetical protein PAA8504_00145 [Palleronia abyssalis]|uniref:Uncharacterized protein n=1 Tax=Palleronia abyssalis TaxID=1501240 RepID=A0A2R8BQA6_9RHOB|nr:hypothetical protein PAA8504_00145 [Palleronia abyssalis]